MMRICSVDGCSRKHNSLGYCQMHRARMRNHGTLVRLKEPPGAKKKWLDANLIETDECIVFPFSNGIKERRGFIRVNGKSYIASRYVCEQTYGAAPTSKHEAAHSCGNAVCVNPKHLRWATRIENEADKLEHGTRARGSKHGGALLNEEKVKMIRASSKSNVALAKELGVSYNTIWQVRAGVRWQWQLKEAA